MLRDLRVLLLFSMSAMRAGASLAQKLLSVMLMVSSVVLLLSARAMVLREFMPR